MNSDTEILFPLRVIPALRGLRGKQWAKLVDHHLSEDVRNDDLAAFSLMMVKLCNCNGCNADSFRAMRGCTHCATLTVRRFKNSDEEMIELYNIAKEEALTYLNDYE